MALRNGKSDGGSSVKEALRTVFKKGDVILLVLVLVAAALSVARAGKKVLLIDLDDICGGECKLNDISSQADVRPSSFKGIDYLGYHGAMASDMLLNDKFAALTSSLREKYDKILLLYRYSEDADTASAALIGGNDALVMVYLVKSGYTKRTEIDNIAKSGKNRNKAAYYIY